AHPDDVQPAARRRFRRSAHLPDPPAAQGGDDRARRPLRLHRARTRRGPRRPDLALYFRVPIEVSLERLLAGRAKLKYHEAGMDVGLSPDPVESFRLF